MKVKIIFLIASLVIIGAYSNVMADIIPDPFIQNLTEVKFWALDNLVLDNDNFVSFAVVPLNLPVNSKLEYSLDDSTWYLLVNHTPIPVPEQEIVYLRFFPNQSNNNFDRSGQLTFTGSDGSYNGLNLY
ncbi:MAG: hypothetical protein ABII90_11730, partial [Bacteroidota bacterium]